MHLRRSHSWLAALLIAAMAAAAARAAAPGQQDPLARPATRLGPGCVVGLQVAIKEIDEEELCGEFALDDDGRLTLKVGGEPIAPIALKGATAAEARARIAAAIGKYYAAEPVVRVVIARVPRIRVTVEGATFRQGTLTLADGSRLSDALAETGYFPTADLRQVQIARVEADGNRSTLTADFAAVLRGGASDQHSDPVLRNGDRVTLGLVTGPVVVHTVGVVGEVARPGPLTYKAGMTVADALTGARGLLASADPERVTIRRLGASALITVNGERALRNVPTDNLPLEPDDTLVVAARDSGRRYAVVGAVPSPATFDYTKPVTLKQAIVEAGGFRPDADRRAVVLVRNMLRDPARAEAVTVDYDRIARGQAPDVPLQPGDVVQVAARKKGSSPILDVGLFLFRLFVF